MKTQLYVTYVVRSLRRGGQRTVLAIFCIAVGVMAVVALQLAGLMVGNDLTGNVRQANGGDISLRSDIDPLSQADATYIAGLAHAGRVLQQTAETDDQAIATHATHSYPATVAAIDPGAYPLVGQPDITRPAGATLRSLLAGPQDAVISTNVADSLHVGIGDQIRLNGSAGRTPTVHIVGLLGSAGLGGAGVDVFLSRSTYQQGATAPLSYNAFYMTTSGDAQANSVAAELKQRFPLATVQTVADALKSREDQTNLVHELLEVVGIIALLIGGFGVVNTMHVQLARRRMEIAMLKTTGYRRGDLFALFGLEAAVLGLLGGVVGALLGVALSFVIKSLLERAFGLHLPLVIDPGSVLMGVVVGLVTAVIFGLQPIVRAAAVRPQAVLRDASEPDPSGGGGRWGRIRRWIGSGVLFLLLSVVFCILASIILGSVVWGLAVVYGSFVVLGVLSVVFGLIVWLVGKLPVPERFGVRQAVLSTVGLVVAVVVGLALPSIGVILGVVALMGYVVAFLPGPWKVTIKMALRNIGRQRTRATMTLLALFVGVFSIGLMVILGQDIRDKLDTAIATQSDYNVVSLVPARWASQVDAQLTHLSGLKKSTTINAASAFPVAVNGKPIAQLILADQAGAATGGRSGGSSQGGGAARRGSNTQGSLGIQGTLAYLSGLGGYDLPAHQSTDTTINPGDGRDLTAADAGTSNVLLNAFLHTLKPLQLQVGDHITLTDASRTKTVVVTVVGFYSTGFVNATHYEPILASRSFVHGFAGSQENDIYALDVDPQQVDAAVTQLNTGAPQAQTLSLASLGTIVDQILGNLITLLVALAALALFAGIIIIANAVALAMLERRREQGILKSMGYTSGRVLASVLIENGVIGGLGGVLAMLLVALATTVLAKQLFKTTLDLPPLTIVALIALVTGVAVAVAMLVSWGAVRVRPLEVLRYE